MTQQILHLPVEQTIIVPSTKDFNRQITHGEMNMRVNAVRKFFSQNYGGYTSVKGSGGYYSDSKNKLVSEGVVKVTGFSSKSAYAKNSNKLQKQIRAWGRKWKQESVGYEREGDLYIYNTETDMIEKKVKKARGKYI